MTPSTVDLYWPLSLSASWQCETDHFDMQHEEVQCLSVKINQPHAYTKGQVIKHNNIHPVMYTNVHVYPSPSNTFIIMRIILITCNM